MISPLSVITNLPFKMSLILFGRRYTIIERVTCVGSGKDKDIYEKISKVVDSNLHVLQISEDFI